jgi:phosphoenolpyruvate carboxylase
VIDDEKKKLQSAIKEMSMSMTRVDAEKDLQKDIIQSAFDDTGVDKKYIRKLAMIYHKQSLTDFQTETEEVQNLYEDLFL